MLAAIYNGNKNLVLGEYPLRTLERDELLIKVSFCGVCGTDKHIFEGKAPSSIPVILGHEYSGEIMERSTSDSRFNVGDKVAIDPNIYCGYCDYCRKGMVSFCKNANALGVTINGGFAEYSIVPAAQAYFLPNDFDLSAAAFSEPLSCCLRGIKHAEIRPGDTVVVIGGGSIGMLMIQLIKNAGASKIILVEPEIFKQKLGIELGADFVLSSSYNSMFDEIQELSHAQVDVVIECVGSKETVEDAIKIAGRGGRVVIFGLAPKDQNITINLQYLFHKELQIFSSFLNPFTFKSAIDLLVNKKIKVYELITQQIYLKDISQIFSGLNISNSVKVQIINN